MHVCGYATDAEAEKVALRVAMREERGPIVVDRGDATGSAVFIDGTGYRSVERSTELFRRNGLIGALPDAIEGAKATDLLVLRELLNVSDDGWPFVVAWMVASLFPDVAAQRLAAEQFALDEPNVSTERIRISPRDPVT